MQCLEGAEFELYAPFKWKPVELFEELIRREWSTGALVVKDYVSYNFLRRLLTGGSRYTPCLKKKCATFFTITSATADQFSKMFHY